MKQLYYITITGRYLLDNDRPSKRRVTFSIKDTNTDLHVGGHIFHRKRLLAIEEISFEKLDGYYA